MIEDTAWGLGAKVEKTFLGTWGRMGTFSFDYAKTITTGEGGMIVFKNKRDFLKAKAWHDHGHHNNPNVPRWEDTRDGSGFNYRMTELQAAVGIAQLRKLSQIVKNQRQNKNKIWGQIKNIKGISKREMPSQSYDSCDALVFLVPNNKKARECREYLLKAGISTKILPEAIKWHFAGEWKHIPELIHSHKNKIKIDLAYSKNLLNRSVSIPISSQKNNFLIPLIKFSRIINKVFST